MKKIILILMLIFTIIVVNGCENIVVDKTYCLEDSDCVLGIRLDKCCDCPKVYTKEQIEADKDLVIYQQDKDYSELIIADCKGVVCAPCEWVLSVKCVENQCQKQGNECTKDEDCVVRGEIGICNCGCYNKDYHWKPEGECFCLAPTSCKCVDGKCEGVFEEITNFKQCVKEGGMVMESYPRKCKIDDKIFTEEISLCASDEDCVPATCCHPSECVPISQKPDCTGIMCSQECAPETMDCGQGHCECVDGFCEAVVS